MLRVVYAALNKCTVQPVNSTLFFFSLKFLAPCLLRELSSLVHMHQHLWCLLLVLYIWSVQIFSKLTLFGVILFKDLSCDKWHKIAYSGMTMLLILPGTFFPESRFPNTLNSLILYYSPFSRLKNDMEQVDMKNAEAVAELNRHCDTLQVEYIKSFDFNF